VLLAVTPWLLLPAEPRESTLLKSRWLGVEARGTALPILPCFSVAAPPALIIAHGAAHCPRASCVLLTRGSRALLAGLAAAPLLHLRAIAAGVAGCHMPHPYSESLNPLMPLASSVAGTAHLALQGKHSHEDDRFPHQVIKKTRIPPSIEKRPFLLRYSLCPD